MKCISRSLLLFSLAACLGAEAADPPFIVAQGGLPGRLPGTLPGQQPPAAPKPAAAPSPAPGADIPAACCEITAIDKAKSAVSARERASGRIVEFKVGDSALLQKLKVGQAVHANFNTKQVSVDGKTMCCAITSVAAPPTVASKTPAQSLPPAQKAPQTPDAQQPPQPRQAQPPQQPPKIAATDPAKTLGAPQGLPGQRLPGQPPAGAPAKPTTAQAPLPSRAPPAEPPKTPGPLAQGPVGRQVPDKTPGSTPSQPGTGPGKPGPSGPLGAAGAVVAATKGITQRQAEPLPQVTAGTPRSVQTAGRAMVMQRAPRSKNPNILQLKGIDEIRAATGLHQGARDLLVLHARTLEAHDMDEYIVNSKLADEWFKKHPKLPDSVHEAAKDKGKKKKKGCSTKHISTGCVKNEVKQAEEDLTKVWRKAYRDTTAEAGRAWDKAQDCFSDHTLPTLRFPVKFSETPEFSVPVNKGGVKGNVTVGVPMAGDFMTELKLFYIPCMPFAVRPKTLGAKGTMESGGTLRADLTLTGQFDHTFTVPPNGVKIPIQIIPIVIGGVPIAEMDVSLYVEGNVRIDGKGTLNGKVKLHSTQKTGFDFECSGHGCNLSNHRLPPTPKTDMESIKLDGRVRVRPAIYTALQLSFDWELLEARAGAEPFLLGEIYGCAAASGTQSPGASTSTSSQSIVADLDWGLNIRAEAFAANKLVAKAKPIEIDVSPGTKGKMAHLYFKDLVQSTGLVPVVTGASQAAVGQPTAYTITMPECYPYRDGALDNTLQYRVTWTGGASGSAGAPAGARDTSKSGLGKASSGGSQGTCTFQAGQGTCSGAAPASQTAFNLTWPASGDYVLTVAPVDDKHGHKFDASRAKQVNVKVQ